MLHKNTRGFTLIELMIVVAIAAILAAIAYPAYNDSVRKSRRADAISVLTEAQNHLERFYTENGRYDQDTGGTAYTLPTGMSSSPRNSSTTFYTIAVSTLNAQDYILTATAQGDQTNDACGNLTLNHAGLKGVSSGVPGDCW